MKLRNDLIRVRNKTKNIVSLPLLIMLFLSLPAISNASCHRSINCCGTTYDSISLTRTDSDYCSSVNSSCTVCNTTTHVCTLDPCVVDPCSCNPCLCNPCLDSCSPCSTGCYPWKCDPCYNNPDPCCNNPDQPACRSQNKNDPCLTKNEAFCNDPKGPDKCPPE